MNFTKRKNWNEIIFYPNSLILNWIFTIMNPFSFCGVVKPPSEIFHYTHFVWNFFLFFSLCNFNVFTIAPDKTQTSTILGKCLNKMQLNDSVIDLEQRKSNSFNFNCPHFEHRTQTDALFRWLLSHSYKTVQCGGSTQLEVE